MYNFNLNFSIDDSEFSDSNKEMTEFLLLKNLAKSEEPLGSWILRVLLEMQGIDLGTATIGRHLKNMDSKQYTKLVGNKGRVITSKGRTHLKSISEQFEREQ